MSQKLLFDDGEPEEDVVPDIPGLTYIPEYIDRRHELRLLHIIDEHEWSTELKRRVQHYGYKYDYHCPRDLEYLGHIPRWATNLAKSFQEDQLITELPDQLLVNEYQPGQGIAPHIDLEEHFGEAIVSLSLGTSCVMDFIKGNTRTKASMLLKPRDLLIMKGDVRHKWKHGIAQRKTDNYQGRKIPRKRRISLTFRKVKTEEV